MKSFGSDRPGLADLAEIGLIVSNVSFKRRLVKLLSFLAWLTILGHHPFMIDALRVFTVLLVPESGSTFDRSDDSTLN